MGYYHYPVSKVKSARLARDAVWFDVNLGMQHSARVCVRMSWHVNLRHRYPEYIYSKYPDIIATHVMPYPKSIHIDQLEPFSSPAFRLPFELPRQSAMHHDSDISLHDG